MRAVNTMSKADLVRQRQQQALQGKINQTKNAVEPPLKQKVVPIVTRKQAFATSYPIMPKQASRRQYNYSIGATGAAVRLPAISSINIGWRFLSLFLGIFCMVGIFLLFNSNEFKVQQIQTAGLIRLTTNDLNAVLNVSEKPLVFFDANQAVKDISIAFPELTDVQISMSFPNNIKVSALERQPVLNWQTEKQAYWIDPEGVIIPPRGQVDNILLISASSPPPVILSTEDIELLNSNSVIEAGSTNIAASQVNNWGEKIDPVIIDAANQLASFIPSGSQILYNNTHGMGWKAEQGWDVFVGLTLNDIQYKLNAYQALVQKLSSEGINPSMVSVEFAQRPYYRE